MSDDATIPAEPAPPTPPAEPDARTESPVAPAKPPSEIDYNNFEKLKDRFGGKVDEVDKYLKILPLLSQVRKDDEAAKAAVEAKAEKEKAKAEAVAKEAAKEANALPPWAPKNFAEEEARKLAALTSPEVKKAEAILKASGLSLKDLTLDLTDRTGKEVVAPGRPTNFGPKYLDVGAWNPSEVKSDHAVKLTAEHWKEIFQVNKCLYGFTISEDGRDVVKARLPAFVMVPSSLFQPITPEQPLMPPTGPEPKVEVPIVEVPKVEVMPEFEVADGSSISIHETTTELQKSLAENGFSSLAVQASASGGAFGVSAGVSSGLRKDDASGTASTDIQAEKEYFATYNFPRARVTMDPTNLALSPQATSYLDRIISIYKRDVKPLLDIKPEEIDWTETEAALVDFSEKFGHVFATRFQLGGQLLSTKFASSTYEAKEEDFKNSLKTALALSWSSQYTSGSVSTSYERQKHENSKSQTAKDVSQLAWTARGGNTLLCANPPLWAGTVGLYSNWRTIEQEKVLPLYELYGKFNGYEDIPRVFWEIASKKKKEQDNRKEDKGVWNNRIKLQYNGNRLGYDPVDTGTLRIRTTAATADDPEPEFIVLNGNFNETGTDPTFKAPLYDRPLFLVADTKYQRDKRRANQIPGLWVDQVGKIKPEWATGSKIARWSLRRLEDTNTKLTPDVARTASMFFNSLNRIDPSIVSPPWDTTTDKVIKEGDQVILFSHSVNIGYFRDPNFPPSDASPATVNSTVQDGTIRVWGYDSPTNGGWDTSTRYDDGEMADSDVIWLHTKGDVAGRRRNDIIANTQEILATNLGYQVAVFTVKFA
ncbi:hypothetical protein BKA65DRAFT_484916 [Rhexocercosporidium sp. MPI-PUGE-AT-0058]|nr:hypothetical protein BKA65DRAFT_484916 [Rhexocercosporidium sp. MPI-PUGE-AT-0058]